MAWRCSGATNAELIENLFQNNLITSPAVRDAMSNVDRAHFVPHPSTAYEDSPQSIGHAATISAPHMHASATESLLPFLHPGARVLDIGSGSGYLTAVFAELVFPDPSEKRGNAGNGKGSRGEVVGLEHIKELCELGKGNMGKSAKGKRWLRDGSVRFVVGDGRLGWRDGEEGGVDAERWDAIHVGAAAVVIHQPLIDQLKRPGRMFIPVEDPNGYGNQHIWVVDKDVDGKVKKEKLYGVRYVPLTDGPK